MYVKLLGGGETENSPELRGECLLIINQKKCDLCCQKIPYSYYCWGSNYKCITIHIKTIHDYLTAAEGDFCYDVQFHNAWNRQDGN